MKEGKYNVFWSAPNVGSLARCRVSLSGLEHAVQINPQRGTEEGGQIW